MNLFGKKKAAPPKLSETIQRLREALDTLDKREKHLDKQIAQAVAEAKKKSKAKDKRGALFQIKRKRMYEKQIEQIYGKKSNIEMQIMALESAASNKEVLDVMKIGKDALKSAIQATDVEKVEETMEDINEQIAMGEEIGEAMSNPIGAPMDEEDLSKELEEMEAEMTEEELLEAPVVPKVNIKATDKPAVVVKPTSPKPVEKEESKKPVEKVEAKKTAVKADNDEARELKELEALMGV
jgi:charged multivesicular body protein 4